MSTTNAAPTNVKLLIADCKSKGVSKRQTAKDLSIAYTTVARYWDAVVENSSPEKKNRRTFVEKGDDAELSYTTPHRIRTKEDAIKYGEIDLSEWAVKECEFSSWEVVAKNEALTTDEKGKVWKLKTPKHHHLWAVKLKLTRIMPKPYLEAVKSLFAEHIAPPPPARPKVKVAADKVSCMFGMFDVHFGKHCWAAESGEDQDLKSTDSVYSNAFDDLRERIKWITPEEIVFPVGNDFVHTDNKKGETSGGTYVGTDSRHSKVIRTAFRAQENVIQRASLLAPVRLLIIPGNHDDMATFYLGMYLEAAFRNDPRVILDLSPMSRKYHKYGATNMGFQHGHLVRPEKLPGIMQQEQRDELFGTKYSEWFTGHNHRTIKYEDTIAGSTIHSLQALSATDTYHFDHGFLSARRAAEVYVFERADGLAGNWLVNARV